MLIHSDFSRRAIVTPADHDWVASPQPGVERVMLDRIGSERARATSLVRYQPHSVFPAHGHPGGEEILVLDGQLVEGREPFGRGSWMRLPPGAVCTLTAGADGVTIYLKAGHLAGLIP